MTPRSSRSPGGPIPVEIRYRPYGVDDQDEDDDPADDAAAGNRGGRAALARTRRAREEAIDQAQAICDATDELLRAGDGDILVFLSGEREITDTAEVLRGHLSGGRRPARRGDRGACRSTAGCRRPISTRCSRPHSGRRIVLATNVAETSLTVPGIRYVIDPGTARISRYSPAQQGAAAADRTDLAGLGRAAGRPLRPGRRRHLHPAVLRGGLPVAGRSSPTPRSPGPRWPR